MKGKIIEACAGRLRDLPGWAVALTFERKGFGRMVRTELHFTKRDSENFWEGPLGWYVVSADPIAKTCEDAVAAFTPWQSAEVKAGSR